MQRLVLQSRPFDSANHRKSISFLRSGRFIVVSSNDAFPQLIVQRLRARELEVDLHSWNETPPEIGSIAGLLMIAPEVDVSLRAFAWLQKAGAGLHSAGNVSPTVLACITRFGGDFGLVNGCRIPLAAALCGLVKTASQEWPEVHCRVLDTETNPSNDVVDRIVEELFRTGPVEIGVTATGSFKLVLDSQPQQSSPKQLFIRPGDLVVASGGARGVTAETTLALAKQYQPTLLLLGRSTHPNSEPKWLEGLVDEAKIKKALLSNLDRRMSPKELNEAYQRVMQDREIKSNLERIRATGAVVEYKSVDIRDHAAVSQAVNESKSKFGPVRGFVHGSGVLADKRIEDKSPVQFDYVYRTKVDGLDSLLAATAEDSLRFIGLFSSSTARFGRIGQCDYAAANEVLNATARKLAKERPNCRIVAFNWGPWEGGMVTPALRSIFESERIGLIPLEQGAQFFVDELSADDRHTDIVVLGSPLDDPVIELSPEKSPWLSDHVLDGHPVLPLAIGLELFLQHIYRRTSDLAKIELSNVQVLRPVTWPRNAPIKLTVVEAQDKLELKIVDNAMPNYRCQIGARVLESQVTDLHSLSPYPMTIDSAYETVLFHGPTFRCITDIIGISTSGIRVICRGSDIKKPWLNRAITQQRVSDPVVIDTALQAVILWGWAELHELSLPVAIGAYRQFTWPFPEGSFTIDVSIAKSTASMIEANATIVDARGQRVVELEECEFIVSDRLFGAFGKSLIAAGAVR